MVYPSRLYSRRALARCPPTDQSTVSTCRCEVVEHHFDRESENGGGSHRGNWRRYEPAPQRSPSCPAGLVSVPGTTRVLPGTKRGKPEKATSGCGRVSPRQLSGRRARRTG